MELFVSTTPPTTHNTSPSSHHPHHGISMEQACAINWCCLPTAGPRFGLACEALAPYCTPKPPPTASAKKQIS
eukprot:scaffold5518_cov93-Skeletonema_marinoi.AAC.1